MFSEELRELDRNTVQYMIDDMKDEIDAQKETIDAQNKEIEELKRRLAELGTKEP